MKLRNTFFVMLISLSALFFSLSNNAKAEDTTTGSNSQQVNGQIRVELVWIDGVLWIIVYDSDENVIQASAVGHSE